MSKPTKRILRWFRSVKGKAKSEVGPDRAPVTKIGRSQWHVQAQPGEFEFHLTNNWRRTDDFMAQSVKMFDHFGFDRDAYRRKVVIDLGAGSKLRTRYFRGAELIAIEPLAARFQAEIDFCDLGDASEVYSTPAEDRIESCVGRADLLVSMNVLDHCFDFPKILENVRDYLKDDGLAFLSFDKHEEADEMHPLELTEEICERLFHECGLRITKRSQGFGNLLGELQTYGHGPYCLNYWLVKG